MEQYQWHSEGVFGCLEVRCQDQSCLSYMGQHKQLFFKVLQTYVVPFQKVEFDHSFWNYIKSARVVELPEGAPSTATYMPEVQPQLEMGLIGTNLLERSNGFHRHQSLYKRRTAQCTKLTDDIVEPIILLVASLQDSPQM